jgi:hypothetical protein
MTLKRKFDAESDDAGHHKPKQLKLVPFPNCEADNDCMMTDAEPQYSHHHYRNTSSASTVSSNASASPVTPPGKFE